MTERFFHTRLAPSPTGALHLGHARTFLLTWWTARQAGARISMRMEDLDAGRAKAESVGQAYADLRWLGMDWDPFPETPNTKLKTQNEVVQSERMGLYAEALQRLWERGAVYPCVCTRADIAASVAGSVGAPHEGEGNVRYPGTCRGKTQNAKRQTQNVEEVERMVREETGKKVCWRLRVEEGVVGFEDLVAGRQGFDVGAEVGDFPVTRFEGVWPRPAYQLACVVDDHAMGIDLVMRGDDLLSSTPRQILLYRALGWEPPKFAHVPLVIGADGKRLAKRHGESRIAQFRERGVSAERVVGWVAWRSGQSDSLREMSAAEVLGRFDLGRVPRERIVLGEEDLAWLM
ncbi:MAG TPA: tRNA glutamyl-Q(34) synthetase GluQRS [Phycisphaerae bacterium]|nr:tRNA glutamyl-Q(34) synthetase GluQRS [Phycisphaerae bacterium]